MVAVIAVLGAIVFLQASGFLRPVSDQAITDQFHHVFYDNNLWQTTRWLGIPAAQNPNDVWIHQELIVKVKPDVIVEAGTQYGGSAALWATILQQVNPDGKVITIDIQDQAAAARNLPIVKERVEFLVGSSVDPAILAEVRKRVEGKKVMVILDSDHRKPHVLAELNAYGPMVSKDSYLIVQDTNVNGHPVLNAHGPGPMEAVNEFLATNHQFRPDRNAERLKFTMHPSGYLQKVE